MPALSLEPLGRQVGCAAGADHGRIHLAGIGFGRRDQVLDRLDVAVGAHRQRIGNVGEHGDTRDVLERVVRQVRHGRGRHRPRRRHDQDRVAVGLGLRHQVHRDAAAAARAVFDHEGLAGIGGEPLGDRARSNVGAAARRKPDDDPHRLGGPVLGECASRHHAKRDQCAKQLSCAFHFVPAPCSFVQIASGVIGSSSIVCPRGKRASLIALAIAAGAPRYPASPEPFCPNSVSGEGVQ